MHGLTDDFLADKPLFAAVADELLAFVAGAEIVIHNAAFDVGFLDAELKRLGRPPLAQPRRARSPTACCWRARCFPARAIRWTRCASGWRWTTRSRELHGALLDAGLLAEVYLRMTRGQDSLVIDAADGTRGPLRTEAADLRRFALPVVCASPDEEAAHEAVLAEIDEASGGRTVWRRQPRIERMA